MKSQKPLVGNRREPAVSRPAQPTAFARPLFGSDEGDHRILMKIWLNKALRRTLNTDIF